MIKNIWKSFYPVELVRVLNWTWFLTLYKKLATLFILHIILKTEKCPFGKLLVELLENVSKKVNKLLRFIVYRNLDLMNLLKYHRIDKSFYHFSDSHTDIELRAKSSDLKMKWSQIFMEISYHTGKCDLFFWSVCLDWRLPRSQRHSWAHSIINFDPAVACDGNDGECGRVTEIGGEISCHVTFNQYKEWQGWRTRGCDDCRSVCIATVSNAADSCRCRRLCQANTW